MRKPEPLGIKLKTSCKAMSGVMLYMEIMRGKDVMKLADYNAEYGATTGCSLRMRDATVGCGQKRIAVANGSKTDNENCEDDSSLPVSTICSESLSNILSLTILFILFNTGPYAG